MAVMDPLHREHLRVANLAVSRAQSCIRDYFNGSFAIDIKADNSPVTVADIEAEKCIRETLLEAFPEYGFYGEETGTEKLDAGFLWLVDPIDGTKSFVRRSPFFSTQIALMTPKGLEVGVSNAPCYAGARSAAGAGVTSGTDAKGNSDLDGAERVEAASGGGCRKNGDAVSCSKVVSLEQAFLSSGNLKSLASDADAWARYAGVVSAVARVRGYGDFCHYHQLVCGQADLVIESDVNILDIAALVVAVREAGGIFTDLQGADITLDTTSVLAAATPELHATALQMLSA